MSSPPASGAKRARPKPKPRLKTGAAVASAAGSTGVSALKSDALIPTVDLTSSSPATNGLSAEATPRKKLRRGTGKDDDALSRVVNPQLISDDIEIVETSAQARARQQQLPSSSSVENAEVAEERQRREAEEAERERLAEEEWMKRARRTVRHVPAISSSTSDVKGKGRASSVGLHDCSQASSDGGDGDMSASPARKGKKGRQKDDEGEYSARNMRRYRRRKESERAWIAPTGLQIDFAEDSSSSDPEATPQQKAQKAARHTAKRVKRKSLTPPPPVDEAILQRAENIVQGAMAGDIENPLLRDAAAPYASDEDDDFDYFGTSAAAVAAAAAPSPPLPVSKPYVPSDGPIELGDSDDDDNDDKIQATFVKSNGVANLSRASSSHSRQSSHTRSPSAPAGRGTGLGRNPLMYGAPDEVKISLKIKSHHEPGKANAKAIEAFERPLVFKVSRWDPIRNLITEAEKRKRYEAGSLIILKDDTRVYPSTNPETLQFFSSGELVGYRKDVYEAYRRKQEAEKKKEAFREAQLARDTAAAATRNSSSPIAPTSALPRPASHAPQGSNASGLGPSQPATTRDSDSDDAGGPPAAASGIKITMRGRTGAEVKLIVKPTQTIEAMLNHWGRKMGLNAAATARLRAEFDGEVLERSAKMGETDMENDDLLMITGV